MISDSPATDPSLNRKLITITVMGASVLSVLDSTIANVALPRMQGSFSASQDQITWVLTSYIVAAAIMTPLTGWLAGKIGRKQLFLYSIAGFTISSALCGMAESLPAMVFFRLFQGLAGAALVPMSQAVLFDINPPELHGKAMATWGQGVVLAPILGPILGGWLTDDYNWRWVFYINVPLGALATLGVLRYMPDTRKHETRFDIFGFSALALAIGAFQIMLDRGQQKDWFQSTEIIIEATVAGLALYFFVVHSATSAKPFFPPTLFKDPNFLTGNTLMFVISIVIFATLALLPPLMQNLLHYPVLTSGLMTAPRGIGGMMAMLVIAQLVVRFGPRLVMAVGLAISALATWQMTHFSLTMDREPFFWAGILQGLGTSISYIPLTAVTFGTLLPALRNEGTAFFSLVRNVGSSVGISMVQALLVRNSQISHANLSEHVTHFASTPEAIRAGTATPAGLASLNELVTAQAPMIGYIDDFKFMFILIVLSMPLLLLLRAPKQVSKDDLAHVAVE